MSTEMTVKTACAVSRVREAQLRLARAERVAKAAVDACNEWHEGEFTSALVFVPMPGMQAAVDLVQVDRVALNAVYDQVRVTSDLPEGIMMHVLNRRFQVMSVKEWCEQARALGGPKIGHHWLRSYVSDRLYRSNGKDIDERVRRAAMLMDGQV
ncbi:hypothetical protein MMMDOFMJ_3628 [Methylobacterium gnaphalii]|nr:hypothetical protein MMMDOFMJ_3628 [Methylobacterium gnaphalii]